ncbi:MAG: hypothetical protein ACK56I_20990, partial [bacterium]
AVDGLVVAALGRIIVDRPIDVDGGVVITVEEVGLGVILRQGMLGVAGEAKEQPFEEVEPAGLEGFLLVGQGLALAPRGRHARRVVPGARIGAFALDVDDARIDRGQ